MLSKSQWPVQIPPSMEALPLPANYEYRKRNENAADVLISFLPGRTIRTQRYWDRQTAEGLDRTELCTPVIARWRSKSYCRAEPWRKQQSGDPQMCDRKAETEIMIRNGERGKEQSRVQADKNIKTPRTHNWELKTKELRTERSRVGMELCKRTDRTCRTCVHVLNAWCGQVAGSLGRMPQNVHGQTSRTSFRVRDTHYLYLYLKCNVLKHCATSCS